MNGWRHGWSAAGLAGNVAAGAGGDAGWAGAKSARIGNEEMSDRVRWIRSYVVHEPDGRIGTFCIYEADSPEAIRAHAEKSGFGAEEINAIADTVIIRPDPVKEPAAS